MRESQSAVRNGGDTAVGPDDIPCSTICLMVGSYGYITGTLKRHMGARGISKSMEGGDCHWDSEVRKGFIESWKISSRIVDVLTRKVIGEDGKQTPGSPGIRSDHSTTIQLVYLENAIKNSFIKNKHMVTIFFD